MIVLLAAVGAHHSPSLGDLHHGSEMAAVAQLCLGVFTAVGAAVVAVTLGLIALGRWPPLARPGSSRERNVSRPPEPRARAGPALLVLLCVSRR